MQLSTVLKINNLKNGTYAPREERESYTITIEETKKYIIDVKAPSRDKAAKVALGLKDLGLVKESPELAVKAIRAVKTSQSTMAKMRANAQVTQDRIRNSFARLPGGQDGEERILGYSRDFWENFLRSFDEDDYPRDTSESRPMVISVNSTDDGRRFLPSMNVLSQDEIDALLNGVE